MAPQAPTRKSAGFATPVDIVPQTDCPFLCLPPELRNRIYEHVLLPEPTKASAVQPTTISIKRRKNPENALNLLQTCRLIHAEAESIVFARDLRFDIHDLVRMTSNGPAGFFDTACKARLDMLRHITVSVDLCAEQIPAIFRRLRGCTNLEAVDFDFNIIAGWQTWIDEKVDTFCTKLFTESETWFLKKYLTRLQSLQNTRFLFPSVIPDYGRRQHYGHVAPLRAAERKLQDLVGATRPGGLKLETHA